MLEHTFVHISGVGPATERKLWDQGIVTWTDALDCSACPTGFSNSRWSRGCRVIEQSRAMLERGEHSHFADGLSNAEHWRAWDDFRHTVAYLDIETTGCHRNSQVTVVGLYDGVRTHTFVAGDNLEQLPEVLESYGMLVTFNGASFDLPFIERRFPEISLHHLHIDLMYALRRIGLSGGLKSIERQVGIERDDDLKGLGGWDAVRLWREYRAGDEQALDTLVRYNAADIENLEVLAARAYRELRASMGLPCDNESGRQAGE